MVPTDATGRADVFAQVGLKLSEEERASGGLGQVPAPDRFVYDRQGARLSSRRPAEPK